MSKIYTAKVRVKGNWFQDEVETESLGDVAHILSRKYGVDPQQDISDINEKRGGKSSSGGSSSGGDSDSNFIIGGGICALAAAWWLLPWVLSGVAIYGGYKISKGITGESVHSLGKKTNQKAALTMALIVSACGAGGFIGGKSIKGEFNSPTPAVVEEVKPSTYVDQTGETVTDNQQNFYIVDGKKVWY
tara:strand:- start:787 stop:1353 length:567 start_codon:yes stop_codon:yes gene_type:complete